MNSSCQRWTNFATSSGIYIRGAPLISSPPDGKKVQALPSEIPEDLSHLNKTGITRLAFIAKPSAAPIAMVEEMHAFCNKALLSSSSHVLFHFY
ncbi:hypothetical protein EMCRGX_G005684 [Ephydatia muelleri]